MLPRLLLLLSAALLAACSTGTRLAYNHLDTLARWEAGKYVDLTAEQRTAFDAEFRPVWAWHRRSELPRYAAELRAIARQLAAGNPDRAAIDRFGDEIESYGDAVADRIRPGLARLLARLDDAQVEKLLADRRQAFDKSFRKQHGRTLEQRREKEQDEREDGVATWIGPLNPAQKALLAANIADDVTRGAFDVEQVRIERNRQLDRLAALLAQRRQPDFESRIKVFENPDDPAMRRDGEALRERSRAQLAALSAAMDAAQREHLRRRLLGFAEDFAALAAESAPAAVDSATH